jgi:hypothetical protein
VAGLAWLKDHLDLCQLYWQYGTVTHPEAMIPQMARHGPPQQNITTRTGTASTPECAIHRTDAHHHADPKSHAASSVRVP